MPELPEVETIRLGLAPHLVGRCVTALDIRETRLRWPVPSDLAHILLGQCLQKLERRAKYLLFRFTDGALLVHLGMSGSLRLIDPVTPLRRHDHLDWHFGDNLLRYHDPRRFGAVLWTTEPVATHPLLATLGPEPLSEACDGAWLAQQARSRRCAIKTLIMDQRVVVGVGNIYANEALYRAGIHPARIAATVDDEDYARLARSIKAVLQRAIQQGGTTLRDFVNEAGRPGYFQQTLQVYGRAGESCRACGGVIIMQRIGQRSSFHCPNCQR